MTAFDVTGLAQRRPAQWIAGRLTTTFGAVTTHVQLFRSLGQHRCATPIRAAVPVVQQSSSYVIQAGDTLHVLATDDQTDLLREVASHAPEGIHG